MTIEGLDGGDDSPAAKAVVGDATAMASADMENVVMRASHLPRRLGPEGAGVERRPAARAETLIGL